MERSTNHQRNTYFVHRNLGFLAIISRQGSQRSIGNRLANSLDRLVDQHLSTRSGHATQSVSA